MRRQHGRLAVSDRFIDVVPLGHRPRRGALHAASLVPESLVPWLLPLDAVIRTSGGGGPPRVLYYQLRSNSAPKGGTKKWSVEKPKSFATMSPVPHGRSHT